MHFDLTSLVIVFILGVFSTLGGWRMVKKMKNVSEHSILSKGKIVDLLPQDKESSAIYFPVVEYKIEDGSIQRSKSKIGSTNTAYVIGEEVEVIFDKKDPSEFMIKGNAAASFSILLLFAGIILMAFALAKMF